MLSQLDKMREGLERDRNLFQNLPKIEEKIKFLLRYAILAPSTHNTQPWLFKIQGNTCSVHYNPQLKLKYADPKSRDLYISLGCAIENLIIAAKYYGQETEIVYLANDNNDNLVTTISFTEGKNKDDLAPLIETILHRVNTRGSFIKEKISSDYINQLKNLIDNCAEDGIGIEIVTAEEKIKQIANLTQQGMRLAHANKDFRREMSKWITSNYSRRNEGMIGYSMNMPGPISLFISKAIRFFNMGPIMGKINYLSVSTSPFIFVFTAPELKAETWIKLGRLAERLMLELQKDDYKTSIYLASIEIGDLYKQVREIIGAKNEPQFIFAAGKMKKKFRTTPRHDLEKKLLD
jgi:hypothetical protein